MKLSIEELRELIEYIDEIKDDNYEYIQKLEERIFTSLDYIETMIDNQVKDLPFK